MTHLHFLTWRIAVLLGTLMLVGITSGDPRAMLAHARLDRAAPAVDAVVDAAPTEIRIWTTQELTLSGNRIEVMDSAGVRLDNDDTRVDQSDPNRKQLVVTLSALPPGPYAVRYTLSSAEDGHTATETYSFTIAEATGDAEFFEAKLTCTAAVLRDTDS